jgi:hypothetical protein
MILYYNTHKISEIIKDQKHLIERSPFLLPNTESLFNSYEKFGLNKHNAVYDRTGHLPHYLNMSVGAHPIPPKVENYNKSFWEITEQRAKELLATDKQINVMWSGGIDSTYILFTLRHFANDPDQIKVYGTYNSIIESGDLFDRRIKNEFKHKIKVSSRNDMNFEEDSLYVSGMCGNQLFGPTDDMFASNNATAMFHHTLGTPETIYEPYENNINPELLEFLDPIIKNSPKKIETVNDLRWYCIFNLDWYTALYEHKILLTPEVANRVHGFFSSEEFQSWSVNTKEPFTKVRGNPNTHRWQMRQILDEMFDEPHYAYNKPKKISTFSFIEPQWLFLLDGYHNVLND